MAQNPDKMPVNAEERIIMVTAQEKLYGYHAGRNSLDAYWPFGYFGDGLKAKMRKALMTVKK